MNISVPPSAGQSLPSDWRYKAPERKREAESAYLDRLQNAWRGNLTSTNTGATYGARLRSDSRMDGLTKVRDDDEMQIWESTDGVRVVKRK